jgi:hypothetical protein
VAGELQVLLAAIAEAQLKAAQLSAEEAAYLPAQFRSDVFGSVLDSVDQYRRRLSGETAPLDLSEIRRRLAEQRVALASHPLGISPEAAALLPLILAAELGAASRLESDRATVLATLEPYNLWIARMRTGDPGTIAFRQQFAEGAHDGNLKLAMESHLGRRMGLSNFLLAGNQKDGRVSDPCVVFANRVVTYDDYDDVRGAVVMSQKASDGVRDHPSYYPAVLVAHSRIAVRSDSALDIRLIEFVTDPIQMYRPSSPFGWPSLKDNYCYIARSETALSKEAAINAAGELEMVQDDKAARARIAAAVNKANGARVQIALCAQALRLLYETDATMRYLKDFALK